MYWIALLFFMIGVLVPEIVQHDYVAFHEDEVEVLMLLVCNSALFLIYLWTDRALRATQINTRAVVQESRDASKDLGKAYSHIGEMNRKIDIVTQFAALASHDRARENQYKELCDMLRESAQRITRYEKCHVYIIDSMAQDLVQSSPHAPQPSHKQIIALVDGRTGTHVPVGTHDETIMFTVHKTLPPLVIVIVAENVVKRMTVDETLLKMISMIALSVLQGDVVCKNNSIHKDN